MRVVKCEQGDSLWIATRLGLPTSSRFAELITPSGKPSRSASGYLHALVAERLLGVPLEAEATQWMHRGTISEREAVAFYELQRGIDTAAAGFCLTDDGRAGSSPDRFVGDDGLLEIKCPSAAVQVGYLLDVEPRRYWPQIQGQLWVTGRAWVDFCSYCPELPAALVRYERDSDYIAALAEIVTAFADAVDEAHAKLAEQIGQKVA